MTESWAWAGSIREFLAHEHVDLASRLSDFHISSMNMPAARTQIDAWDQELKVLRGALRSVCSSDPQAGEWGLVLEFELPLEGGRRPDAVLLVGGSIAVLEFKPDPAASPGQVDQVVAYARDLSDYHSASRGRHVTPVLVLARNNDIAVDFEPAVITGPNELPHYLLESASPGSIDLDEWLRSPYEPLPTLVAAARRIFREEGLPHVRSAESSGIPQTLKAVDKIINETQREQRSALVLVAGVPGSGKTLVGLRLVYELADLHGRAIFLSGNGPLVQVLQDALKSRVFVRDLHAFIKSYGLGERRPAEHVIVFDEAQRAWDANFMQVKRGVFRSEPELLVEVCDQLPEWGVLVGLVGHGQEIYSGEEGGIQQWRDAILSQPDPSGWTVHCPSTLESSFEGLAVDVRDEFDLTKTLRSHRAENLHEWVSHLLAGSLALAARLAARINRDDQRYPMYVTRSLDEAKSYVASRHSDDPEARYGLLVAAHAKVPRRYGIDNHFMAMKQMKIGPWFNAAPNDSLSCRSFNLPATEFQVQGLELDLPIVCWGEDFLWDGENWKLRPARAKYRQVQPDELLRNAYRVLLTRGRDGLILFVPGEPEFDATEVALLAAGVKPLENGTEFTRRLRDLADGVGVSPSA